MNIKTENTRFIFLITSKGNLEDRFVDDIKNCGIAFLQAIGFPDNKVTIVSDTPSVDLQNRNGLSPSYSFIESSKMLNYIETIACDNLIIVSSCHGSIDGIDSKTSIKPYPFISALNNNPYAKSILVMFGQCFSGIFNYADLSPDKTIVLMGASGMNESASTGGVYQGKPIPWCANIAVWAFFDWMANPKDIDGDNRLTSMDLFKYMSMVVLKLNDAIEHSSYGEWIKKQFDVDKRIASTDRKDTAALDKLNQELEKNNREYFLPRQFPWIQNTAGAVSMAIDY